MNDNAPRLPLHSTLEAADTMPAPAEAVPIVDDVRIPQARALGRLEAVISTLLRAGVIVSIAVIFIGMIVSYARHPEAVREPDALQVLTSKDASFPHSLNEVLTGVLALRGQAIMALGLLILIATPVLRVAASVIAFAAQRDVIYFLITSTVLALLVLSFLMGHVSH